MAVKARKSINFWLFVLPSIAFLFLSLFLALKLRYPAGLRPEIWQAHFRAFSLIFIFWLLVFFSHGLFEVEALRRYTGVIFNLVSAMLVNLLIAVAFFYFQPNLILTPRRFLFLEVLIAFVLLLAWYLLVKYFAKSRLMQNLYLFSLNNELADLEREIEANAYLGFKVLGHLNPQNLKSVNFQKADGIVLPENLSANPEISSQLYQLRTRGVSFFNHWDFYEELLRRVYLSQLNEIWFLENVDYQEKRIYNVIKRLIDLALGLLGLLVFVITFPLLALLVKLSSKGSVLFIQARVGKNGEIFRVYKYRTMAGGPTNTWTSVNDPRITKIGKFLRLTRLDEFPQFMNLILGHLSLVGPRPEQPHIVEELKKQIPFYDERHLVKPGLTGWAQINNIYAGSAEETKTKLQYDLYYIKHRSLLFDLEIIIKTIYYIFTWQGR